MTAIQLLTCLCLLVAVVAMIAKALRYMRAPSAHMRWELYPVPHEKGRAEYGGSYLEEADWWTKPRQTDTVNELKEMAEEIILLKGVYNHNRRVWSSSMPFHLGLYLCIGWMVMLLFGAILELNDVPVSFSAGAFGNLVHLITIALGYSGLALSGLGALGLFLWRVSDGPQRQFNAPIDYFNLLFFVAVSAVSLISHLSGDATFETMRGYVLATITLSEVVLPSTLFAVEVVLISLLMMWIPLTRMSHFVAKYFLYHDVRWNDKPNERGSRLEKSLMAQLSRPVGWSADHIKTGKTWGEVVSEVDHE
jgi:nitrate reductase gamma subunit